MLGNTDNIRKKTEEYNKDAVSYGGVGGRLLYEAPQTRTARIFTRLAIGTAACLFLGAFGVLCAALMFNLVNDNHSLYKHEDALSAVAADAAGTENSGFVFAKSTENISVIRNLAAVENVTKEESERYRVPTGVMVHELVDSGALDEAGVIHGDIIVAFEENAVTDAEQLGGFIKESRGKTVCLTVYRNSGYVKLYASFD